VAEVINVYSVQNQPFSPRVLGSNACQANISTFDNVEAFVIDKTTHSMHKKRESRVTKMGVYEKMA
jgi:hypothetical protein